MALGRDNAGTYLAGGRNNVGLPSYLLPPESLNALTEAAAAINSTLEMDAVLEAVAQSARTVTHAEASAVFLLDPAGRKLRVAAATGPRREAVLGLEFEASAGIAGWVVRGGQSTRVPNAEASPRFHRDMDRLGSYRARSLVAAPMVHRSEVIGVIEVVNRLDESEFSEADLKLLELFATLATSATRNARAHDELRRRYEGLRDSVLRRETIIGESPRIREMLDLCRRVAPTPATVLILGETGTGKELTARHIHNSSKRADQTFIAINCAALPETLLESELFGHEKGSFTGAHAQRLGWFEVAEGGTLFLDEIGEISRSTQSKLLRVLQEREITRVGGTKSIRCDVRVLAATNRNLKHMMIDGLFREDLYYRLSVFPIHVPPLRERSEDLPRLIEHFLRKAAAPIGRDRLRAAPDAVTVLTRYTWPGNIRELQNVIDRSVLMCEDDVLRPEHLPPDLVAAVDVAPPRSDNPATLYGQEKSLIVQALEACQWNQTQAAKSLGITRDHLRHRIKRYQIIKPAAADRATA